MAKYKNIVAQCIKIAYDWHDVYGNIQETTYY